MKTKAECNLADELRCCRSDSRKWRCRKARVEGSSYCEHHRDKIRSYHSKPREKKKKKEEEERSQVSLVSITNQCPRNKRKINEPEIAETIDLPPDNKVGLENPTQIVLPANYKRQKIITNSSEGLVIGITKQCLSGKYKIREPEIAETIVLPAEILGLDDLTNVLTVETWRESLSPAERCKLGALLPKGGKNVVETLLNGENLNFGNPVVKWGTNVCNGKQRPDALVQKESELKLSQSQYFKDIATYKDTFLARIDKLEELCESCNRDEAKFSQELKQWRRST